MNESNLLREEVMPKKGPQGSKGPGDGHPKMDPELARMLDNPPDWLARQMKDCREDPERFLRPTSSSLAYKVFGTPAGGRADQVREALISHLGIEGEQS